MLSIVACVPEMADGQEYQRVVGCSNYSCWSGLFQDVPNHSETPQPRIKSTMIRTGARNVLQTKHILLDLDGVRFNHFILPM